MNDLVISYGLLHQAAADIQGLSPEIDRVKNTVRVEARGGGVSESVPGQVNDDNTDLGPGNGLFRALGAFYAGWSSDMQNAMDGLDKLAGYFNGVADTFMEMDASQAAGLNEGAMMSAVLRYPSLMDQYTTELTNMVDPDGKLVGNSPTPPDPVPDPYSLAGTQGLSTSYTQGTVTDPYSPDGVKASSWPNYLVTSETTTVTVDGMTYQETTTFGPDQGWGPDGPTQNTVQTIANPDGSTDTITTTTDTSGKGNETDVSSTGTTSTYTRADWKSSWVDTTPAPATDSDGSGSGGDDQWWGSDSGFTE